MQLSKEQQPKVIKVKERNSKLQSLKRKVNKPVDQDFLMYNSPEDEDYLRNVVKDNYSNTVEIGYNSSEY